MILKKEHNIWNIFSKKDFQNKFFETYILHSKNVFSRIILLECMRERALQNESKLNMTFWSFHYFIGVRKISSI